MLNAGEDADSVDLRFGSGELRGTGRIKHHGDPHEDFVFHVHPRKPNFTKSGILVRKLGCDTLLPASDFCKECVFVRRLGSGVEYWRCLGHDCSTGDPPVDTWPKSFEAQPLNGKILVEVFSGLEDEGGAMLSRAWEAAGGVSIRYDERQDDAHNFLADHEFWREHLEHPRDAYHFAFPCHHMSVAHTTPKVRTVENPYGDETDAETCHYNQMAMLLVSRIARLARHALILVEQPLLTYLYLMKEMAGIIGIPGMTLFRADDCMVAEGLDYNQLGDCSEC